MSAIAINFLKDATDVSLNKQTNKDVSLVKETRRGFTKEMMLRMRLK